MKATNIIAPMLYIYLDMFCIVVIHIKTVIFLCPFCSMADIIISRTKNDSEQSDICFHGTFAIDSLCQMKFKPNCSLNKRHFGTNYV